MRREERVDTEEVTLLEEEERTAALDARAKAEPQAGRDEDNDERWRKRERGHELAERARRVERRRETAARQRQQRQLGGEMVVRARFVRRRGSRPRL